MDSKKVLEVIELYRKDFKSMNVGKIDFPHSDLVETNGQMLAHCHGMLDKMETFVAEGRMEKTFRWLGFIQGCLWSAGIYTLEDLMNHNRPKTAD